MKFFIILSVVLVLSELHRTNSDDGVNQCSSDNKCSNILSSTGSIYRFCNFWYGEFGECEQCDQVSTVDDCSGLNNDKGIRQCKQICFSEREVLSGNKACDSLDKVPCSTCAKYTDGKKRRKPLDSEDAKCVWLPGINGCKTKAFAEKKIKDYVEICPEEDHKDDCSKYDGKLHITRNVCCNNKCQGCGGVQGKCAKLSDNEGKILGASECCGKRIEDSGITCGINGRKAPCVLPDKN